MCCMCVCVCVCVCVCILHVHAHVHMCMCMCVHANVCVCVCVCVCVWRVCACLCACVHVHVSLCVFVIASRCNVANVLVCFSQCTTLSPNGQHCITDVPNNKGKELAKLQRTTVQCSDTLFSKEVLPCKMQLIHHEA